MDLDFNQSDLREKSSILNFLYLLFFYKGELQVASEIKNEIDRVNKEMRKCELAYKKRIDEVFVKREALKVLQTSPQTT